ncbi:MAG: sensor histidine kinase, partial [Bdellovibrionales bacterium]|nr:sensor histidine kinase [Bdellovibrionales bacterium]
NKKEVTVLFDNHLEGKDSLIQVDKEIFIFQVISNFLTNAAKFSTPGSKVLISLLKTATNDTLITIRDWGTGIEKGKISKLFSWNEKTSTIGTKGEKGTGLGLPLANKFIQDMGGDLKIESHLANQTTPEKQGTLITIMFPHDSIRGSRVNKVS